MTLDDRTFYRDRRVLITGGLGFIGSNLARRLVALGANVIVIDSLIPDYGGNLFNISGIVDRLTVNISDVRDASSMHYLVRGQDVIFNLAGQVSHIDSMNDPYTDLEINCRSQLSLLEACRKHNPAVKIVFAGTVRCTGIRIACRSRKTTSCDRSTSTASTRRPASTTTSYTTTSLGFEAARSG